MFGHPTFKENINRSIVIPDIALTSNLFTLSMYETSSTVHLLIEYMHESQQRCVHYSLGKDGLSMEKSFTFFSDRALATCLLSERLNDQGNNPIGLLPIENKKC